MNKIIHGEAAERITIAAEMQKKYSQLADTLQEEYDKQQEKKEILHKVNGLPDPDDDQVNNPSHYQSMTGDLNIDCITAMRAAFGDEVVENFCICNAFKYVWRHQSKNGKQDIEKAIWYLNKYLELDK